MTNKPCGFDTCFGPKSVFLGQAAIFTKILTKTALLICVLGLLMINSVALANTKTLLTTTKDETTETAVLPKDSYGRDNPRSMLQDFMKALASGDSELSAKYLDDAYLNKKGVDNAEVLDKLQKNLDAGAKLVPMLQISDQAQGNTDDLLPSDQDKIGEISVDGQKIDLLVVQKKHKDGTIYWQIAKETLEQLPNVSKQNTLANRLTYLGFKDVNIGKFNAADVVALLLVIVVALFVCYVLMWLGFVLLKLGYPLITRRQFVITPKVIMPLSLVLVSLLLPNIMLAAGVPLSLRAPAESAKEVVAWVATTWLILRLIDAVFGRAERSSLKRNRPEQLSILGLLRKLAKVFMLILAFIIIFGNLGFDLTTGIAALGIGGLALAFGAQKTIENLIGSVVVVADRPVHVGDYCKFGTYEGVVMDIGIRSTRVRTLNRTTVTIPNGDFSSLQIENYATRDMFHFLHYLYLKRDTAPSLLAQLIKTIKAFLDNHHDVNDEWTQVRISELRQDCFVVELRAYIITTSVVEFYDKQTQLIIEILEQIEKLGVEYALPATDVHLNLPNTAAIDKTALGDAVFDMDK